MTASLQKLLDEEKIWTIAARVVVPDGEENHYRVSTEGHVVLSVETLRHGVQVDAILPGGDDEGTGAWWIPSIGTEVMISFDDGQFEGDAYVVSINGKGPAGLVPGKLLLIGDAIEIRSKNGTAKKLLTEDDGTALVDAISSAATAPNDGGSTFKTNLLTNLEDWPSGTSVVKGE